MTVTLPGPPALGANDYTVHLARASTAASAPEDVTDANLTAVLDMPAMGHGSAGTADPKPLGHGDYAGTLHFTMPGEWRLTVAIQRAGVAVGNAVFNWSL